MRDRNARVASDGRTFVCGRLPGSTGLGTGLGVRLDGGLGAGVLVTLVVTVATADAPAVAEEVPTARAHAAATRPRLVARTQAARGRPPPRLTLRIKGSATR